MTNYYDILEINQNASQKEIKTAWKRLAKKFHPDKAGNTKHMQDINEAYETLSDINKRKKYDDLCKPKINNSIFNTSIFETIKNTKKVNFNNLFIRDDITNKGNVIILHKNINEIIDNHLTFNIDIYKKCSKCNGTGIIDIYKCCNICNGTGTLKTKQEFNIQINNEKINDITLKNVGNYKKNGKEGDIIIYFDKKNETINVNILANIYDMYFGNNIKITIQDKHFNVKLQRRTQSGTMLRIKKAGKNKEDVIITIMAYVPQHLKVKGYDIMNDIMTNNLFFEE